MNDFKIYRLKVRFEVARPNHSTSARVGKIDWVAHHHVPYRSFAAAACSKINLNMLNRILCIKLKYTAAKSDSRSLN